MIHLPDPNQPASLKQVEFNTISSSFGALSERAANLHRCAHSPSAESGNRNIRRRYLYRSTQYYGASPHLREENFPENNTTAGLAEGLAEAHKAYGVPK